MNCPVVQGDQEIQKGPDFRDDLQNQMNPDLGFPSVLWVHDYQGTQRCQDDLNRQRRLRVKIILTYTVNSAKLTAMTLECCGWLPGYCYVVANEF